MIKSFASTLLTAEAKLAASTESLRKQLSSSLMSRGSIGTARERLNRVERRKKIGAKLILTMVGRPFSQPNKTAEREEEWEWGFLALSQF
jgi:hypothetical protein